MCLFCAFLCQCVCSSIGAAVGIVVAVDCVECGECAHSLRFSVQCRCIGCCAADFGVLTCCVNDRVGCGCMFRVMWLYIFGVV